MRSGCFVIIIFFLSCASKESNIPYTDTLSNISVTTISKDIADSNAEIIEVFIDSLNIGKKGNSKIELIKHRVFDNTYIIVKFFTRGPNVWYIQNTYLYECEALNLNPVISDFNNDKFNDTTFISAMPARGANEIRRLFIYDVKEDRLVSIVNSENYPNMLYNKELDCIDAFLVYGGCSTIFLKIRKDSLKEFASVELSNGLTVRSFDEVGKEKIILQDTKNEAGYIRYRNFKPLKEYDEY